MTSYTYQLEEITTIAKNILTTNKHKILLFKGMMGIGKTTLIKEIVKQLGSIDVVSSPSFALVNEYKGTNNTIYHFDFYRIRTIEEAYQIGLEDYLYNSHKNIWCLIEWPEKIAELLPEEVTTLEISKNLIDTRTIKIY